MIINLSKDSEIYLEFLGKVYSILLDTGAQATVISQSLAEEYRKITGEPWKKWKKPSRVLLPNGNQLKIEATILLKFFIGGEEFSFKAIVVPELQTQLVLGRDFLQKYGAQLDYDNSRIIFYPQCDLIIEQTEEIKGKEHAVISVTV